MPAITKSASTPRSPARRTSLSTSARTTPSRSVCLASSSCVPSPHSLHFRSRVDALPSPRRAADRCTGITCSCIARTTPRAARITPSTSSSLPRGPRGRHSPPQPRSLESVHGRDGQARPLRSRAYSGHERIAGLSNLGLGRLAGASWTRARRRSSRCGTTSCATSTVRRFVLRFRAAADADARAGVVQHLIAPDGSQLDASDPWIQHENT